MPDINDTMIERAAGDRILDPGALLRALDLSVPCWFAGCDQLRGEYLELLESGMPETDAVRIVAERVGRAILGEAPDG